MRQPTSGLNMANVGRRDECPAGLVEMSCSGDERRRFDWNTTKRDQRPARSNGKLQLAAVVHYNSMERLAGSFEHNTTAKHDNVQRKSTTDLNKQTRQQQQVAVAVVGENSHVDAGSDCKQKKPTVGRLSRLFFTKNNAKKKIAHKQNGSNLIDNSPSGEHKREGDEQMQMQMERAQQQERRSPPTNDLADGGLSEAAQRTTASSSSSDVRRHPVIEFKFDLIVEGDREELPGGDEQRAARPGGDEQILRPIRQRKLLDNVNELVESFVLDSMDACLLTTGKRRLPPGLGISGVASPVAGDSHRFDYLLKCAEISITYAFQLLDATKTVASPPFTGGAGGCSPLRADGYSIELEAVLFEQPLDGSPIAIVDLLDQESPSTASVGGQMATRECSIASEALEALEAIRLRLDGAAAKTTTKPDESFVLMVNLKLKQQVNGGNFSNRLCLLDLSEPTSSELATIVESIFSGQALAHLKRQKLQLRTLELQLAGAANNNNNNNTTNDDDDDNNKHHHQVASLTRLIRAEWLIYKQLSSALIKTLVIVHCHKLAPPSKTTTMTTSASNTTDASSSERPLMERHLMDYNLDLLEFVRRLQRASMSRLKRRKRHLRSNLAKSNLSLVSDTNLSMASSAEPAIQDLMISSPFRHHGVNQSLLVQDDISRTSSWLAAIRPGSSRHVDCYSSHMRHQKRHASRRGHHYRTTSNSRCHHHHYRDRHSSKQPSHHSLRRPARAASLNWRDSTANELDATESSSPVSTTPSSVGNRKQSRLVSALDSCVGPKSTTARVWLPAQSGSVPRELPASLVAGALKRSPLIGESDVDESIASLASTSLASCRSNERARNFNGGSLLASDTKTRRRLQQFNLDSPSDSNTLDDSIELQSFSSNSYACPPTVEPFASMADNVSDTCSVAIAEPPRQLKLEEFLNKLSNFIGPQLAGAGVSQQRQLKSELKQGDTGDMASEDNALPLDEDDEDCKSHSSILEHLSSLTLESNLKMVKQQQQQISTDRVSMVPDDGQCDGGASGHLQRLLRSTLRLQQKQQQQGQPNLTDQLRALTIDCTVEADHQGPLTADRELCHVASGETPLASMESSCASSSSSSSSSSSYSRTASNANQQRTLNSLYASVIRHQKTPQIKLP